MIPGLLLAQVPAVRATPAPAGATMLSPPAVLQRYAAALKKLKEPRVITFDYTLDQTGSRTLAQTHRVFREAGNERDETLTVDGKRLTPPKIRIFRGRRNRYAVGALAPRVSDYDFAFVGPRKNVRHFDYVFRLTPHGFGPFAITQITIDGVRFLPSALAFSTFTNDGSGTITFGRNAEWWVPYLATAQATVADAPATEKLSFYTYRFPPALPSSTFAQGRRRLPPSSAIPTLPIPNARATTKPPPSLPGSPTTVPGSPP